MAEFLSTGLGIGIVVGVCALALILFLYGVFRRFSRCSWLSWQILILFAAVSYTHLTLPTNSRV